MKYLLNIRGAVASGKTTAVRQFCEKSLFRVEFVEVKKQSLPVSVINNGKIVVLGNYGSEINCTGVDSLKIGKEGDGLKRVVSELIIKIFKVYNPEIIIYESMIISQVFKSTKVIADIAKSLGYDYLGIQLYCTEKRREKLLEKRSGRLAGKKNFSVHSQRVNRATEMLNENGYFVKVVNVENIGEKDMWKIVQEQIDKISAR